MALSPLLKAEEKDVALTIYNNDLALVRESRKMTLKNGAQEVRYADVASRIDPTSLHIKSLTDPDKVAILHKALGFGLGGASAQDPSSAVRRNPLGPFDERM